ncbi:gap junction delta-4 protein [Fundulus heteroclitus]|uniref:gap junction delta-4 protein n=1 Tax=Fundulus heteroclitus TaxID=8078 RepID=UPI00165A39A1|nr:gap junction delta-4 protein [Fundulus heteroclitus]
MVGSSVSEILFISVNRSITLMGKVWLVVMIFLRVLILLFAGYPLYRDEQERFVCNTIQPGCANVCYDLFSPVSLFRFWLVQLVALCLPYVVFVIYVVHKVSGALSVAPNPTGHAKTFQMFKVHKEQFNKMCVNKVPVVVEQKGALRCFTGAYILHLLFRTLLEAGFGAAHYYMFGFYVPRRFLCQHAPCTTQVDCYISRPTEKTVMLNFMLAVAALSLFLNVLDFIWAIKRSLKHNTKRKTTRQKTFEEELCFLSAGVASTGMDANPSPTQQDQKAQPGNTESFRKRRGSKGSCGGGKLSSGQEASSLERCSHPCSSGAPCCNSGNNDVLTSQEEVLERSGSEVALCPQETAGTPRSIRVNKRSRVKPPPPPRLDLRLPSGDLEDPVREVFTTTAVCTGRVGQYSLFELGNGVELQSSEGGQEKRSEWV